MRLTARSISIFYIKFIQLLNSVKKRINLKHIFISTVIFSRERGIILARKTSINLLNFKAMILSNPKFWVGMALGAIAGAVAYKCAQCERTKAWLSALGEVMHSKGCDIKLKMADAGADVADAVAEVAHGIKEKVQADVTTGQQINIK